MDTGTLVTILVVALVVLVLLFLVRAAGIGRPRPPLRALPPESRDRYISEWDEVEMKFVEAPEQAVREAEAFDMAMVRGPAHPMREPALPAEAHPTRSAP